MKLKKKFNVKLSASEPIPLTTTLTRGAWVFLPEPPTYGRITKRGIEVELPPLGTRCTVVVLKKGQILSRGSKVVFDKAARKALFSK